MKKASRFLKQLFSAIVAAVRESSAAMRSKTSAVRTRLIFLGILRNRKLLMSAISSKIHALVAGAAQAQAQAQAHQHGNNNINNGAGLLAARGKKKAAVLQSLPSFVVDQERKAAAVMLLNSLPSFAMGRDTGSCPDSPLPLVGAEEEDKEEEGGEDEGNKQQLQLGNNEGSVIELARGAAERSGVEFRLEDEIDRVADVFIRRFHDQMKLQKLDSFKRFCEMLDRN